jgi:hypothetical protein
METIVNNDIGNNIPTASRLTCARPSFIINAKIKGMQAYLRKTDDTSYV